MAGNIPLKGGGRPGKAGAAGPPGPPGPPGTGGGFVTLSFTHADFQAGALQNALDLYSLAGAAFVGPLIIRPTVKFEGTGITKYSLSIGIDGDAETLQSLVELYQVDQVVAGDVFDFKDVKEMYSFTDAKQLKIQAVAEGANLSNSTAGAVDVLLYITPTT